MRQVACNATFDEMGHLNGCPPDGAQINRPAARIFDPSIHSWESNETSFFLGSFAAYRTESEDAREEVKSSIRR